jgi:ceramidase
MTIRSIIRDRPVAALCGLIIVSLAGLLPIPPVLQDQGYHQFADQRELFGIPNFWNVVSNLPFIAVGAAGLWRFRSDATTIVLFTGIFLTGFGSSYYHWNPNDETLFWDRLPMTLGFAAILAAVVEERVDARAGAMLLWPLLAIGVFSLLLWRRTGDLRLYAWAQFFPLLALGLILLLFSPKYTGAFYWIVAAVLYALAKLLEFYDHAVIRLAR